MLRTGAFATLACCVGQGHANRHSRTEVAHGKHLADIGWSIRKWLEVEAAAVFAVGGLLTNPRESKLGECFGAQICGMQLEQCCSRQDTMLPGA